MIVKSAEAKGDNRYLSPLPSSLPFCKSVSETRARASAHRGQKGRERSGQAAYPPTTWHTVTRLQSIKCVRLLWLMHYGAIKNGKYSERRAACARPATGPHSTSDEYVRAARCIAFEYNARRYADDTRVYNNPTGERRRRETSLRPVSLGTLTFNSISVVGGGWKVVVVVVVDKGILFLVVFESRKRIFDIIKFDVRIIFSLTMRVETDFVPTANSFPRRQLID